MKNSNTFIILLAAGLAGASLIALSNVVFPESLRGDKLMAAAYSIALILFAVRDYSRRPTALRLTKPAPLLRPALPVTIDARQHVSPRYDRTACAENSAA